MKKIVSLCLLTACLIPFLLYAQQKPAAANPQTIVEEWFKRWNALDGSDASVQKFLELYAPNAMHQVGP